MPRKKASQPGLLDALDVLLHSPLGDSLNELLRRQFGLDGKGPLAGAGQQDFVKQGAQEAREKVRQTAKSAPTPYQVLGVDPSASTEDIKTIWKALMTRYHPQGKTPDEKRAKALNVAYEEICRLRGVSK